MGHGTTIQLHCIGTLSQVHAIICCVHIELYTGTWSPLFVLARAGHLDTGQWVIWDLQQTLLGGHCELQ